MIWGTAEIQTKWANVNQEVPGTHEPLISSTGSLTAFFRRRKFQGPSWKFASSAIISELYSAMLDDIAS